ncbi:MAG: pyruvoyl-dependent arginine decarboxylase [Candidatus Methanoplasma sp.]|jgi:arginine decarboxylase|nr:pyruvoyl-dependent arginine decarboxylase [Candidatus Methanoplasma sp.]
MHLVPSKFFVASGKASSPVSDLNAFDLALHRAGISEQNLVAVSSVIPEGAEEAPAAEMPMGAVTHCVLSQIRGPGGSRISAGIAYARRADGRGGYVAEGRLFGSADALRAELGDKMREMARMRGVELEGLRIVAEEMSVPSGEHGCCVAALVFSEYR